MKSIKMKIIKNIRYLFFLNVFFFLLYFIFCIVEIYPTESVCAFLSILSSLITLRVSWVVYPHLSNWTLWFSGFYFLLHSFGPLVGLIFLGPEKSFINYPTWFAMGISQSSRELSYLLVGMGASIFGLLIYFFSPHKVSINFKNDFDLERVGKILFLVTTPFVIIHGISSAMNFSGQYALMYSAESIYISSIVPFASIWVNINYIGFIIFLASYPSRAKFLNIAFIYLIISLVNSMVGARVLFVIPLVTVIWIYFVLYPLKRIKFSNFMLLFVFIFVFGFIIESLRSTSFIRFEYVINFFVFSISKAQYHVALFLDSHNLLVDSYPFFIAPLLFPIQYLKYGHLVVGQSIHSAALRTDLVHVLPSTLNIDAYLCGAGLGSSLIAESYQYGILFMLFIIPIFYFLYRFFFNIFSNSRILFLVSPIIFSHIIFSPRSTMFFNTWGIIKILLPTVCIIFIIKTTRKYI